MKKTTHILNWYFKHAKTVGVPVIEPLTQQQITCKCLLQRVEHTLASNDFGLNPPKKAQS